MTPPQYGIRQGMGHDILFEKELRRDYQRASVRRQLRCHPEIMLSGAVGAVNDDDDAGYLG